MNKYAREIKPGVFVDVYDVLKAFNVTCPAMAHAVKKALAPGQRGHKDTLQDMREVIQSVERAIELEGGERKVGMLPELGAGFTQENKLTDFLLSELYGEIDNEGLTFSSFKENTLARFEEENEPDIDE